MSLQCHADTSLLTFKWIKDYSKPWPDFGTTHTCRNFDEILAWARDRMLDVNQPDLVSHPELGNIYTNTSNPLQRPGGVEYLNVGY